MRNGLAPPLNRSQLVQLQTFNQIKTDDKTSSRTLPVPEKMHLPVFASNTDSAPKPSELLPCLLPTQAAVFSALHEHHSTYPTNRCLAAESLMLADDKRSHTVYRCCISFIIASGARLGRQLTRFWNRAAHRKFKSKSKKIDKLLAPMSAPDQSISRFRKKRKALKGEKTVSESHALCLLSCTGV